LLKHAVIGLRRLVVSLVLAAVTPAAGGAQTVPGTGAALPGGPESARFRLGPVGLSPRLALTNVGIDTNVFNSSESPTRDVTATFVPGVDSVMRVGRTLLSGRTSAEFAYFRKARDQRSSGFSQEGRLDVLFAKLTPFVSAGRLTTYQRPNAEIDARVRQVTTFAGGGVRLHPGTRLTLEIEGARRQTDFGTAAAAEATSEEARLADALNRQGDLARLSLGLALTPLTTLRLTGESLQERFARSSFRDIDSVTVSGGFEFKPFALISGAASAGVRHVASKSGELADFTGVVASADVAYTWREMTRLAAGVNRSVEPSVDADQPYYVATGITLSVMQALGARWDVVGRGGRQTLDYRRRVTLEAGGDGRLDRSDMVGAGVGFRVRPDVRVGFDVNHLRRRSAADGRSYEGYRLGGSVTYGR
jgi:hypothetical protein